MLIRDTNLLYTSLEPNNESPLNLEAAELWNNQTKYKKYLMEEYHRALDRTQSNKPWPFWII